ncbi:hypothetical protein OAO01_00970 [Oligoflexia bacterium]|nr:hypothetical protein [Oligoflexia bacterium]
MRNYPGSGTEARPHICHPFMLSYQLKARSAPQSTRHQESGSRLVRKSPLLFLPTRLFGSVSNLIFIWACILCLAFNLFCVEGIAAQSGPSIYLISPRSLPYRPMEYSKIDVEIWGENFSPYDTYGLEVGGALIPGNALNLRFESSNTIIFRLPASIGQLALATLKIRLYNFTTSAYSNTMYLLFNRDKNNPPVSAAGVSQTGLDYIWGLWGRGGAVLQEGNIYAFVDLFDTALSVNKRTNPESVGLPVMGFDVCGDMLVTNSTGQTTVVPKDYRTTNNGWRWEGCREYPKLTRIWWDELYPPKSLAAEDYLLQIKDAWASKLSNQLAFRVLPKNTPPYLASLTQKAVIAGYSSALGLIEAKGFNLQYATQIVFEGPVKAAATLQLKSNEKATFTLPAKLLPGMYKVYLLNSTGSRSNSYQFKVMQEGAAYVNPGTYLHMNFHDLMYVKGGNQDRWKIHVTSPFTPSLQYPQRSTLFFWQENLDSVFYDGKRNDPHALLNPDQGAIEIKGYCPADNPQAQYGLGTRPVFRHGYHHIMNIFEEGGTYQSKKKINIRTLYYIPKASPRSRGYENIWSHWNGQTIPAQASWLHFEVYMRDGYSVNNEAVVVTKPEFAKYLGANNKALYGQCFDIKFYYDFVNRKEGALYVKVHGIDNEYVDQTFNLSRRIAKTGERVDLTPLVRGAFDFGSEKRHPHYILDTSQPEKSGSGGSFSEISITDGSDPAPAPTPAPTSTATAIGTYGPPTITPTPTKTPTATSTPVSARTSTPTPTPTQAVGGINPPPGLPTFSPTLNPSSETPAPSAPGGEIEALVPAGLQTKIIAARVGRYVGLALQVASGPYRGKRLVTLVSASGSTPGTKISFIAHKDQGTSTEVKYYFRAPVNTDSITPLFGSWSGSLGSKQSVFFIPMSFGKLERSQRRERRRAKREGRAIPEALHNLSFRYISYVLDYSTAANSNFVPLVRSEVKTTKVNLRKLARLAKQGRLQRLRSLAAKTPKELKKLNKEMTAGIEGVFRAQ